MSDLALIDRDGAIASITLNRPGSLNALSMALEDAVKAAFVGLIADPAVRAIVLTGAGRAFSVGVDLKELGAGAGLGRVWHGPESLSGVMRASKKPIIAAVNGYAVTGGFELALQCDFLIGSEDARFADTHARVGVTPSWGLTQILPRLIGLNRARQMSLTGAYVAADQALDWGILNEVTAADELLPRAKAIAAEIAETEEDAMTKIRTLIGAGEGRPLDEALARERAVFDAHLATVSAEAVETRRVDVQARGKRVAGSVARSVSGETAS